MSNLNTPDAAGHSPASTMEPSRSGTGARPEAERSGLAAEAGEATQDVLHTAKQETQSVASEAGRQARRLAGQVGDELRSQAAVQQARAADALHTTGSSFSRMADGSDDDGYAPQLVRAAGERVDSVASWLGTRDPGTVVQDVKRFARRRPGVFIAIAVGAGIVVGRLTRALASSATDTPDKAAAPTRPIAATRPGVPETGFEAPPVPPVRETVPPAVTRVGVVAGSPPVGSETLRGDPGAYPEGGGLR